MKPRPLASRFDTGNGLKIARNHSHRWAVLLGCCRCNSRPLLLLCFTPREGRRGRRQTVEDDDQMVVMVRLERRKQAEKKEKKQMGKGREDMPCPAPSHVKKEKNFKGKEAFLVFRPITWKQRKGVSTPKANFNLANKHFSPRDFHDFTFFFVYFWGQNGWIAEPVVLFIFWNAVCSKIFLY